MFFNLNSSDFTPNKGGGTWSFPITQLHPHTVGFQCHVMPCVLSWPNFASSQQQLGFLSMTWMLICHVHSEIALLPLMVHNLRDSTQKNPMYSYSSLRRSSAAIVSLAWDSAQRDAVQMCVHADFEPNVLDPWFKVTCRHIFESHKRKPALPFVFSLLWLGFVFYTVVCFFSLILPFHSHTKDLKLCSCC